MDKFFDPFYTTKDFSKGHGTLLQAAQGIVAQNAGINIVCSEPEHARITRSTSPDILSNLYIS
jgi:C4-dicarboxylate-specific signal transduction histidine kinase